MSDIIHYHEEHKIMGYGESDSSGEWIKLQLQPGGLENFRGLKGQRFYVTYVMIGDDEQPIEKKKGGKLSHIAAMLCEDMEFQEYSSELGYGNADGTFDGICAKFSIYDNCGISSRAELDHSDTAAERFANLRQAFMTWKRDGHTKQNRIT